MFDDSLKLVDGSADWSYTNLHTNGYGQPVLTTRNDGGFAVLDMGDGGSPVSGLSFVMIFTEAAAATSDTLTAIAEECDDYDFSTSKPHELAKFDIAAVSKGVILGSEITAALVPIYVIRRVAFTRRYLRISADCAASGDDFGVVYCYVNPFTFKYT